MVSSHHDRTDLSFADHFIELEGDAGSAFGILIQDSGLGSHHQLVFLRIADPYPVVSVLCSPIRIDPVHGCLVGGLQIFRLAGEAYPAERAVAVVEEHRSHDVFHIGRPDESVFIVITVFGDFLDAGVVHGFHEGIAVVEEVGASFGQGFDGLIVAVQGLIHLLAEGFPVIVKHTGSFFEGHAHRAVAAVIYVVAAGLVGQQIDLKVLFHCGFQQIHDVSVVCDGDGFLRCHFFAGQLEDCIDVIHDHIHPSLIVAGLDSGQIHFREDTHGVCNVGCLRLCAAHAAQAGGNEGVSFQVSLFRHAQILSACV